MIQNGSRHWLKKVELKSWSSFFCMSTQPLCGCCSFPSRGPSGTPTGPLRDASGTPLDAPGRLRGLPKDLPRRQKRDRAEGGPPRLLLAATFHFDSAWRPSPWIGFGRLRVTRWVALKYCTRCFARCLSNRALSVFNVVLNAFGLPCSLVFNFLSACCFRILF